MLAPAESAPKRPSPLPVPSALLLAELGPAVMADDPCEAAFGRADPTAPRKNYRARYYDPKIGRFISEGPIGFSGGINFFAYVFNDPVNRTDPSGQAVVQVPPLPPPPNPTSFWQQFFWHFFSQTRTMLPMPTACFIIPAMPSFVGPGPFATRSIPSTGGASRSFTAAQRAQVNEIGVCHTCGTTNPGTTSGNFVLDHQPPNSFNPWGYEQKLYPQCLPCSRQQGLDIIQQVRQPPPPGPSWPWPAASPTGRSGE